MVKYNVKLTSEDLLHLYLACGCMHTQFYSGGRWKALQIRLDKYLKNAIENEKIKEN